MLEGTVSFDQLEKLLYFLVLLPLLDKFGNRDL